MGNSTESSDDSASNRTTLDEAASWTVIAVAFVVAAMIDGVRWWWRWLRR